MTAAAALLILLKVSLVLTVALLGAWLLKAEPAVRRHRLWSAAFVALVALPPLALTLPALRIPVPSWAAANAPAQPISTVNREDASIREIPQRLDRPHDEREIAAPAGMEAHRSRQTVTIVRPSGLEIVLLVWLAGAAAGLVGIVVSLLRVRRLAKSSTEVEDAAWRAASSRIANRLGLGRVRVLASSAVVTPMAGGVVRPTVFVPAEATSWNGELRDVVLAHEMSHLASRDPLRHLVSRLAVALYWFHPLAWVAARRAEAAREQACDESVLSLGVRPSTYAGILLDFAGGAPPVFASAALPIVRPASLESRLMSILDKPVGPSRRPTTSAGAALVAVALTLSIAAMQPKGPTLAVVAPEVVTAPIARPAEPSTVSAPTASAIPATVALNSPAVEAAPVASLNSRGIQAALSCRLEAGAARSFNGSMSVSDRGGVTVIHEQVGYRGSDRIVQKSFGDLRICAVAEDLDILRDATPREWMGRAKRFVLETEARGELRRLEIAGGQITWTVNGVQRPLDAGTDAWRDALLPLLDATWELSRLHGQVSSLRGNISSIHGERSSLLGEISSLRGQVSSMRGEISSIQGERSSMLGEISSIRGHLSSLQGAISSERGAISSLLGSRYDRDLVDRDRIDARIRQHEQRIRDIEDEIRRYDTEGRVREVQRRLDRHDTERQVEEIERRIREFDLDGKIAAVNARMDDLEVDRQVRGIEGEISSLDVSRRSDDITRRRDAALDRLRAVLGR